MQRDPFPLPINIRQDKRRLTLIGQYESKLMRCKNQVERMDLLGSFYEHSYSNGLKDMDNMHKTIDAMISKTHNSNRQF